MSQDTRTAIIHTGGKQHRVKIGEKIRVETLPVEAGQDFTFDKVLMIADGADSKLGTPFVEGSTVVASVLSHGRGKKVLIVKMRRRKHYRRTQGHRQDFTEVQITSIN